MKKIMLLLIFGIFLVSLVSAETFTPIFCNDYEFTGCYAEESTTYGSITDESSWICPGYAHKCILLNGASLENDWYVGSGNCYLDVGTFIDWWTCDNENKFKTEMNPGEQIYLRSSLNVYADAEIKIIKPILKFSGTACGAGGTPVSGADGCTFNPKGGIIYTSDDMSQKQYKTSYTVPLTTPSPTCVMSWVSGKRHICGYKEESCSSDSDCGGHTYGNKECSGRTLQTYGCINYGNPIQTTTVSGVLLNTEGDTAGTNNVNLQQPSSGNADFGKRCDIIGAEQVQCCGDTDCGSGMFCDKQTFTCKEEVECKIDTDCGVSVQCDWIEGILKKPSCKQGKCTYTEKDVECCSNENCGDGGFCSNNYECEKSSKYDSTNQDVESSGITGAVIGGSNSKSMWVVIVVVLVLGGAGAAVYFGRKNKAGGSSTDRKCCENSRNAGKKFCMVCGKKIEKLKKEKSKEKGKIKDLDKEIKELQKKIRDVKKKTKKKKR